METEELEFLISQHLDGTLEAADAARLQRMLATDATAQSLFDEHATLDAALRATQSKLVIDEDWLATQIGDHIDEANAKPIRISNWGWAAPVAMAACLLIGLTLGVIFLTDEGDKVPTNNPVAVVPKAQPPITEIALTNPDAAPAASSGYANVSVGIPANLTPQIVAALYLSQDMNASRVSIRAAGRRSADAFD